jgi:hypothetical protein
MKSFEHFPYDVLLLLLDFMVAKLDYFTDFHRLD